MALIKLSNTRKAIFCVKRAMWGGITVFATALSASAQQQPLIAGWIEAFPAVHADENGEPVGFFSDLARLIAQEAELPLEFREYADAASFSEAYKKGEATLYAGMPKVLAPVLQLDQSEELSPMRVSLFARLDRLYELDLTFSTPQTVGFTKSMQYWTDGVLPDGLDPVIFEGPNDPAVALLRGDVDLVFTSEQFFSRWSYKAGLDHLFAIVPDTGAEFPRVVGLHPSEAEHMPAINAAITHLTDTKALLDLRRRYHMNLYDPRPEVLTVGVLHYPPFQVVGDDGSYSGFGVDVFRDIAEAAGLQYRFREITIPEMTKWSEEMGVDILPIAGITERRRRGLDFTQPIYDVPITMFVRRQDQNRYNTIADLKGSRIGVLDVGELMEKVPAAADTDIELYYSPDELIAALLKGDVSAVIADKFLIERIQRLDGLQQEIVPKTAAYDQSAGIGLRFGLGDVRMQLNQVIPYYILSPKFQAHLSALRGDPIFWTDTRKRLALVLGTLIVGTIMSLVVMVLMSQRARRMAEDLAARTQDVSSRLSAVMNAAQSGIVAFNRQGQIALANPNAREMLGLADIQMPIEWPAGISLARQDGQPFDLSSQTPLDRVRAGETVEGETLRLSQNTDTDYRYVHLSSSPIEKTSSPEIASVMVLDDVTQQIIQGEQVERANRLSAIGQLTGGVAHDFNNLLAVILGNLELAYDRNPDEKSARNLKAAISATHKGADLTKSMLAFARKDSLSPEVIDLNAVVRQTDDWVGRTLPETVIVETSLQARLWKIQADPNGTESALLNLLLNARDAMDGKGNLTIETANIRIEDAYADDRQEIIPAGRYVMLAVSDTGHGIASDNLPRIYEPFFTTKETGKGTGLGLSSVMGFMRQSGGTIQVYSEVDQGTTFKLYFPATDAERPRVRQQSPVGAGKAHTGAKILLVEDEDAVRDVLLTILEDAGYKVTTAENGDAALEVYKAQKNFDVLLTDIVMPGALQGTHLAKELRKITHDLPVVFMSGYPNEAKIHGNGLRPSDVRLTKPIQRADLLSALTRAIKQ
ncbi:transporter substrate-binding domain-containing protein [Shimia sp. MIT1388]|uniref:transporter substrate-binding domain-containing protein n=1 Tax=Shimia sp. MIT1388 TaxID=3096992 RepID=UPI00399A5D52